MYLRWIIDPGPALEAKLRIQEIIQRNKEAKINVLRLRKQLAEAAKEAEALGLLASVRDVLEEEDNLDTLLLEDQSGLDEDAEDVDDEIFGGDEVFDDASSKCENPIQFERLDLM